MKNNKNRKMLKTNDKIRLLILFLAFFTFIFIFRLFRLQVLDAYDYKSKGENVSMIGETIQPKRGNILDRNNNPLAITQNIESLYLLPVTSKEKSEEADRIRLDLEKFNKLSKEDQEYYTKLSSIPMYEDEDIEKICKILNLDSKKIFNMVENGREGYIYRSLNRAQKAQIELLNLNYLVFVSQNDRYYPNGEILSSTLGFLEEDKVANYGLEKQYDEVLSGIAGYKEYFKAIQGTEIPYTKNQSYEPKDAYNLVTSIDINLQKILYNRLKEAFFDLTPYSLTAVLSDPNNGEILAIENLPSFDANSPRTFNEDIDELILKSLDEDKKGDYLVSRWNNDAVSMQYEPGSVYKIITSAIALESENSLKNKIYNDDGYYKIGDDAVIKSWRYWDPFGPQNLKEAFKNSSNPVYAQLAEDITKSRYIKYAKQFRLGILSGIDLPNEAQGFYPKDTSLTDVDYGTLSFGYYATVNPVQFIATLNSTVNGGSYYKPHIGSKITDKNGKVLYEIKSEYKGKTISASTSKEINGYMEYTADDYGLNTEDLKFGAKTGTAYKNKLENPLRDDTKDNIDARTSIYVTYPASNPKYSLLVVVDEPLNKTTSSTTALPVAKKIMYDLVEYDKENAIIVNNDKELVQIPDVTNKTVKEAIRILEDANLKVNIEGNYGEYHIISSQYPTTNNSIEINSVIKLETNNSISMPNLVGMDLDEARNILEDNYIKYSINGEGKKIIKQSANPNDIINIEEEITINLGE